MQKTYVSEYIQVACEQGIPVKEIKKYIEPYCYLYDSDSIWVDSHSLTRWKVFHENPARMWIKYRIKGLAVSLVRPVIRNSKMIQKRRYPVDLSGIV